MQTYSADSGHNMLKDPLKKSAPKKEPLQVRIPAKVKRNFKAHAALCGLEPNELFIEVWSFYEQTKLRKNVSTQ